jgi:5S rRNA maturation endonuclease (ribonuclease M5)
MFAEADMDPRSAYRPAGEEIDGSFLHHGRTMLFEAKWTGDPVPASTLYQFRGKLEGKLTGTLGIFISIGGYSADAVDALVAGKSLNLVLFDREDMDKLAQPHCIDIRRALSLKLRAAAEIGTPYFRLAPCGDERRPPVSQEDRNRPVPASQQVIVVEGNDSAAIIRALHQAYAPLLLSAPPLPTIVVATGHLNLPLVALAELSLHPDLERVVILADGDGKPAEVRRRIQETLHGAAIYSDTRFLTIVVDPELETVLGITRGEARQGRLAQLLAQADLPGSAVGNSDLRQLLQALGLMS